MTYDIVGVTNDVVVTDHDIVGVAYDIVCGKNPDDFGKDSDAEHRLPVHHKLFPANAWMKFFHCTLRPIGTVAGSFSRSDEDIPLDLIFFSPCINIWPVVLLKQFKDSN